MAIAIEDAESAVTLYSMLKGSTSTISFTSCDFSSILNEMRFSRKHENNFSRINSSSWFMVSLIACAVSTTLLFFNTVSRRYICASYFFLISSQFFILKSRLFVGLVQYMRFPHPASQKCRKNISRNYRLVDATSSSCESNTRLSYFVNSGTKVARFSYSLHGSCSKKPKSLLQSMVSRSVRLLMYAIACKTIECYSKRQRIRSRIAARLPILSRPGMSNTLNFTHSPPTSKAVPSQQPTSVVTSLRLLATRTAGSLVSSLAVADLPHPDRPIRSKLQVVMLCIRKLLYTIKE